MPLSDDQRAGREMFELLHEILPINRSVAGDGIRRTFALIGRRVPLDITEIPSGTQVFDWTVPREWNLRDAWIADGKGRRIVDLANSNLHVVSHSIPVRSTLTLADLRPHLHSLPERPDWIPFHTTYYDETWGFCLPHRQLEELAEEEYEICIDATLADGHLVYAETAIAGELEDEILLSTWCCHPSLASELTGMTVLTALAGMLQRGPQRRYTHRFLWCPATIGPLAWLAQNEGRLQHIRHGLVANLLGDDGPFTYKRSRRGDAEIDRAVECVLRDLGVEHRIVDYSPYGGNERQFCSPGFDLPVGSLMRTPYHEFAEYHTSADNLERVEESSLVESLDAYVAVLDLLEANRTYVGTVLHGEPQLGRRGLWRKLGAGPPPSRHEDEAILWVLNLSDGHNNLLSIAERSGLPFAVISRAAARLREAELLREIAVPAGVV